MRARIHIENCILYASIPVWKESRVPWNHNPPPYLHGVSVRLSVACRVDCLYFTVQAGLWFHSGGRGPRGEALAFFYWMQIIEQVKKPEYYSVWCHYPWNFTERAASSLLRAVISLCVILTTRDHPERAGAVESHSGIVAYTVYSISLTFGSDISTH